MFDVLMHIQHHAQIHLHAKHIQLHTANTSIEIGRKYLRELQVANAAARWLFDLNYVLILGFENNHMFYSEKRKDLIWLEDHSNCI